MGSKSLFTAVDRSSSLLDRVSPIQSQPLSKTQAGVDQLVSLSIQEATNLKTAAAMLGAGWVARATRIGALSTLPGQAFARGASYVPALAAESAAFAGIERQFHPSSQPFQKDWARAAVTLTGLKAFGGMSRGQNIILQHLFTDLGLVGGHQAGSAIGLMDKPQGSFAQQMLMAEATNWQMKGSLAFAHSLSPRLSATEKSLDIFLNTGKANLPSTNGRVFSPFVLATEGAPETFLSSSNSETAKESGILKMSDLSEGGGSGKTPNDLADRSEQPESIRRRFLLITLRLASDDRPPLTVMEEILMSDPDPATRRTAAETLGIWGEPEARPSLERALSDPIQEVREAADCALRKLNLVEGPGGASQAVPKIKILRTFPPTVRLPWSIGGEVRVRPPDQKPPIEPIVFVSDEMEPGDADALAKVDGLYENRAGRAPESLFTEQRIADLISRAKNHDVDAIRELTAAAETNLEVVDHLYVACLDGDRTFFQILVQAGEESRWASRLLRDLVKENVEGALDIVAETAKTQPWASGVLYDLASEGYEPALTRLAELAKTNEDAANWLDFLGMPRRLENSRPNIEGADLIPGEAEALRKVEGLFAARRHPQPSEVISSRDANQLTEFPGGQISEITSERDLLLTTRSPSHIDLGAKQNLSGLFPEIQFKVLRAVIREGQTKVFLLKWTGTKIPRGAKILGKEISWTHNGIVTAEGGDTIGTYDQVMESGGPSGKEHQMIIYVKAPDLIVKK